MQEKHCKRSMTAPSHPKEARFLCPFVLESMSGKLGLLARPARVSQKIDRGFAAHRVIGRKRAKVLCLHLWVR